MHNIDVAVWFMGATPTLAVGFGGRARRKTGNQYDFFTVDFTFPGEIHISSMSRQINGTWSREGEHLVGEKGIFLGTGGIRLHTKQKLELPEIPGHENAYVQEHVDLLDGVIKGKPLNEAKTVAESTLAGIMGRISAYTGQPVRWGDVSKPEGTFGKLQLSPTAEDFEKGTVNAPPDDVVPIPGKE
jgi:predicted dehydrogenase